MNDRPYNKLSIPVIRELIADWQEVLNRSIENIDAAQSVVQEAQAVRTRANRKLWDLTSELIERDVDPPEGLYKLESS